MFTKKDREIANQKVKIANRDKLIGEQQRTIDCLKSVIDSLEEDLQCAREEAYKNAK